MVLARPVGTQRLHDEVASGGPAGRPKDRDSIWSSGSAASLRLTRSAVARSPPPTPAERGSPTRRRRRAGMTPGKPAASRAAALNETRGTGAPSHNGPIMRPVAAAAPTVPLAARPSPARRNRFRRIPAFTRRRSADPHAPCQGEGGRAPGRSRETRLRLRLDASSFASPGPPAARGRGSPVGRASSGAGLPFLCASRRETPGPLASGRAASSASPSCRSQAPGIMGRRPRSSRRRERRRRLRHRRRSLFAALASRNAVRAGPAVGAVGNSRPTWP